MFGAAVVAIGAVGLLALGQKVMNVMVQGKTLPAKLLELKDGETALEVQGLSSKRIHSVWFSGGRPQRVS